MYVCITYVLRMYYVCITYVLRMYYVCITYVLRMYYVCITYVLRMYYVCITYVHVYVNVVKTGEILSVLKNFYQFCKILPLDSGAALELPGIDRLFLALLCSAYDEDEIDGDKRSLLRRF